jgi:hypothetical protein
LTHKNINTKGTYSYSHAPDLINDNGGVVDIPFSKGDLTDRRNAPMAGNVECGKSKLNEWIVAFSGKFPLEVVFDFKKAYKISKFKIWFSGSLPEFTLLGSRDLKEWRTIGDPAYALVDAGDDVKNVEVTENFGEFRYVKLVFSKTERRYEISELEFWKK